MYCPTSESEAGPMRASWIFCALISDPWQNIQLQRLAVLVVHLGVLSTMEEMMWPGSHPTVPCPSPSPPLPPSPPLIYLYRDDGSDTCSLVARFFMVPKRVPAPYRPYALCPSEHSSASTHRLPRSTLVQLHYQNKVCPFAPLQARRLRNLHGCRA